MMNIKRLLLLLSVMGFAVGCASTPEEVEGETAPVATEESAISTPAESIDEPTAVVEEEIPAEEDTGDTSYVVEQGDNLWTISGQEDIYDNPYQWPLIYKANRDQIRDADLIFPGQEFTIVRGMSEYEIDAAVNHAKTRGAWTLGEVEASDEAYLNE